jgi:hypothetical protein
MQNSRFIVGIALIAVAVLLFIFGQGTYSTSGAVFFVVLGIIAIAISRRS